MKTSLHVPASNTHSVTAPDGVRLHVPEFGATDGPAIVLIHGWSQCHLSWLNQLSGPLAQTFRIIAPDMRGHGLSDKPDDAQAYNHARPWASDVDAIIAQLGLERPVLAGWSMGGKIIGDYLREFGDDDIGGIAMVATSASSGAHQPESAARQRQGDPAVAALDMYGADLDLNLRATAAFLRACVANPLPADVAAWMLGFNMLCPPHVRAASRLRDEDYKPELARVTKPVLMIAGGRDQIMPAALTQELFATVPHAETHVYENSGHAPFWEEPTRFNEDLRAFVASCQETPQ